VAPAGVIAAVLLDWGNTLMIDPGDLPGRMADWPCVQAVEGAGDVLRILHDRYRLVVATNAEDSGGADVRRALARVGLDALVDEVVTSREVGVEKPDARFYAAALARAGGAKPLAPARAVMVGDSWTNDVQGALAAGLHAIWLASGPAPATGRAPSAAIRSLRELPAAVARLDVAG
jgi:putative hydrolase of the HAD superfamily